MSKIDAENGLTVISKSLLKLAIDELRVSVDEEKVLPQLAEDVTFRLQGLINSAYSHARRCRRKKLCQSDVDQAIEDLGREPITGVRGIPPREIPVSKIETIFVQDPEQVQLTDFDADKNLPKANFSSLQLERQPIMTDSSLHAKHIKIRPKRAQNTNLELSAPLDLYINRLSRALSDSNPSVISFFVADLMHSPKASQIMPFLRHIMSQVSKSSSTKQTHRILLILEAVLRNPFLKTSIISEDALDLALNALQQQIALEIDEKDFELVVRERAAHVIGLIISHRNVPIDMVVQRINGLRRKNELFLPLVKGLPECFHSEVANSKLESMLKIRLIKSSPSTCLSLELLQQEGHLICPFILKSLADLINLEPYPTHQSLEKIMPKWILRELTVVRRSRKDEKIEKPKKKQKVKRSKSKTKESIIESNSVDFYAQFFETVPFRARKGPLRIVTKTGSPRMPRHRPVTRVTLYDPNNPKKRFFGVGKKLSKDSKNFIS